MQCKCKLLIAFEEHTGLTMSGAAALIGCAYVTYTQYRSGLRPLPNYHKNHVEQLMAVTPRQLDRFITEYVHAESNCRGDA